jgi:hypothetical protein
MGRPKAKKTALDVFFDRWKECRTAMFRCSESDDMNAYKIWAVRVDEINVLAERFLGAGNRYAYDRKQRSYEYFLRTTGRVHLILNRDEAIPAQGIDGGTPTPDQG